MQIIKKYTKIMIMLLACIFLAGCKTSSENSTKISVYDYYKDNNILEIMFTPFDTKLQIVSNIMSGVISSVGGINTSLLRRISTEIFIETITNIDMKIKDKNGLSGFDQIYFYNVMDTLKNDMGGEYREFENIMSERLSDYIRIETNPAVTINNIYNQVKDYYNKLMDYISGKISDFDVEDFIKTISEDNLIKRISSGDENES